MFSLIIPLLSDAFIYPGFEILLLRFYTASVLSMLEVLEKEIESEGAVAFGVEEVVENLHEEMTLDAMRFLSGEDGFDESLEVSWVHEVTSQVLRGAQATSSTLPYPFLLDAP